MFLFRVKTDQQVTLKQMAWESLKLEKRKISLALNIIPKTTWIRQPWMSSLDNLR